MSNREARARRRARERRRLAFPLVVCGVIVLIATAGFTLLYPTFSRSGGALPLGTENVKGSATAPVEIELWSDFQCPACKQYAVDTGRRIEESAVAEGRARVRYRHMAFLGLESVYAAQASECAAEQGRFWPFHDRLYAEQRGRDQGAFSKASLKRYGAEIGLDQAAFNSCVDHELAAARVKAEVAEGKQKGVARTPTLILNGRKIEGVPAFEDLLRVIQAAQVPAPNTGT